MARGPLVWSLGVLALAVAGTLEVAPRLARLGVTEETPAPVPPTPARAERTASAIPAARPTLAVAADHRGQFVVHPSVDSYRIRMLVDTGASLVALTDADARALGILPAGNEYNLPLGTANGTVRAARARLREVRLGDIVVRDVDAVVLPPGALSVSLLGTSFLRRLGGYEVQTGRMILRG